MKMEEYRKKWQLLISLTRRDIERRYKDSLIGSFWGLITPFVLLGIYTIIFSTIFHAKWGGMEVHGKVDYAVILFVGLITYNIFAEAVTRAPACISSQTNFVKKVVFPLELLPGVVVLSALYSGMMSGLALLVVLAFSSFGLSWHLLLFPIILIPMLLLTAGVCLVFSSLGVYLKDTDQFATMFARVLQYLTPVLYPSTIFPGAIGNAMRASPLAVQVEQLRALIVFGDLPALLPYLYSTGLSLLVFAGGMWWFNRTRKGFADVL